MTKGYAAAMGEVFTPFGGDDWRECVEQDMAQIGAEEAARQFRQAENILESLMQAANEISVPLYTCLSSAHTLARDACETAEGFVRSPGPAKTRG